MAATTSNRAKHFVVSLTSGKSKNLVDGLTDALSGRIIKAVTIQADGGAVRYVVDGSQCNATTGHILANGSSVTFQPDQIEIKKVKLFAPAGSTSVQMTVYTEPDSQ